VTPQFRSGQWEAIKGLVNRRERRVVIEKTGWGKSYVYFIATRLLRDQGAGPTIIISPLLALMRNQCEAATRMGLTSATINSTNRDNWDKIKGQILSDQVDLVLISPERLANERFLNNILLPITSRIGLFVVDEAHCISDWGHDFRPDYHRLVNILKRMPDNVPILGTTATANRRVADDIRNQLGDFIIQRGSLMRRSIHLQTMSVPDQAVRLAWLAQHIGSLPGTGIIYVLTKRDADRVATWLRQNEIDARAYYSTVTHTDFESSDSYREHLETLLLANRLKVLVATTALGMGYDKPDVGFVIHFQSPGSVISYYQQVGRAGRGLDWSLGLLMSGKEDQEIQKYFWKTAFPVEDYVNQILQALDDHDGLRLTEIEKHVNLPQSKIKSALTYLAVKNPSPILKEGGIYHRTAVVWRSEQEKIQHLTTQRQREWDELQQYIGTTGCRMQYLARALDDVATAPCGCCDNCLKQPIVPTEIDRKLILEAGRYLKQMEYIVRPRVKIPVGALAFYELSGNLPQNLRAEPGRVLSRQGDAGWGSRVVAEKLAGAFSDELVEAVWEMISTRWHPDPFPRWITCVPSLRQETLVPDFAIRLARRSGLPYHPVVRKRIENAPQKSQLNSFHQCHNLDGAFDIQGNDPDGPFDAHGNVPDGPVFLVDDIVDSRWTLTVVTAILKQAGAGPVFPVALASAEAGDM